MTSSEQGISFAQAQDLQKSGDWITDGKARHYIHQQVEQCRHMYVALNPAHASTLNDQLQAQFEEALYDYIVSTVEQKRIEQHSVLPGSLGFPIGRNKILKIGPMLQTGVWQSLNIVLALLAVIHTDGLERIGAAKNLYDETKNLIGTITSTFENLTDPKELVVFEAILLLQDRFDVIDYDAAAQGDYNKAFGRPGPTGKDIEDALLYMNKVDLPEKWRGLDAALLRKEIGEVLERLRTRSVLTEHHSRWRITF